MAISARNEQDHIAKSEQEGSVKVGLHRSPRLFCEREGIEQARDGEHRRDLGV
jgi:hypothetical protein